MDAETRVLYKRRVLGERMAPAQWWPAANLKRLSPQVKPSFQAPLSQALDRGRPPKAFSALQWMSLRHLSGGPSNICRKHWQATSNDYSYTRLSETNSKSIFLSSFQDGGAHRGNCPDRRHLTGISRWGPPSFPQGPPQVARCSSASDRGP